MSTCLAQAQGFELVSAHIRSRYIAPRHTQELSSSAQNILPQKEELPMPFLKTAMNINDTGEGSSHTTHRSARQRYYSSIQ